jgi:murein L,D-transpeptidase YcbB/YkuD
MNKLYFSFLIIGILCCKNKSNDNSIDNASFIEKITNLQPGKIKIDSTLINKQNDSLLTVFYKNFKNQSVWHNKEYRDFMLNEFYNCEKDGLNFNDYNYSKLNISSADYNQFTDKEAGEYDILFTKSTRQYVSDISIGKLNPYKLYTDWDLGRKKVDVNKILFDCIEMDNFKKDIDNCKPHHFVYKQLQDALNTLKSYPDKFIEQIDLKEKITPNTSSKAVIDLKKKLIYWGDLKSKDSALTKIYDKRTQQAVKNFQKRHGLIPDAVVGKSTIEALNFSKSQRIEQVVVNMERWKWCVKDLGIHYILVNIPDYKLTVYKDNDSILSHKVVVGKPSRATPILSSKISNIVLNPNWTVPPTILKEDVFPAALKSKSAFRRKGLKIIDYKGREINPYSWTMANAKKYKYVQNPSRNNSLGLMKIDFPNNYSVYLHDTNHRDLFVKNYRALSSGCVRVENPLDLAEYLINDTLNWNQEKIDTKTHIKPLKTTFIKMNQDIYVHQFYWTAWQEKGVLQFRDDIYCLDSDLYSKLRY